MATFSLCDSCTAHFTALSLSLLSSEMGRSFGSENNTVHAEAPHGAHRLQALHDELLLLAETKGNAGGHVQSNRE